AQAAPGNVEKAEAALEKAIQLDGNFGPAYNLLISIYLAQNKMAEAIAKLQAEIGKQPDSPRPLLMMAIVYERMKNYSAARDSYEKALRLNPGSVLALNNLAYIYSERMNQLDRAYELAQKAHSLNPGDAHVTDTLGWIVYKR